MSLRSRLISWTVIWCAVVLIVFTGIYTITFYEHSLQSYKRVVRVEMAAVLGQGIDSVAMNDQANNWAKYSAVTDAAIRLSTEDGTVLFESGSPVFTKARIEDVAAHVPSAKSTTDETHTSWSYPFSWQDKYGRHHVLAGIRHVTFADGAGGQLAIYSLTDSLWNETWHTMDVILLIDGLTLILFAFGLRWLVDRGLGPLRKLMEGIQAVEWNQSTRLSLAHLPSEVSSLQNSVNQLLERIDAGIQEQNRFIADASHELRTPLAIIAGHANLLRRWGNKNPRVWEPAVRNIVSEVSRLQKLVNQLLTMSKREVEQIPHAPGLDSTQLQHLFYQLRQDAVILRPDLQIDWLVHLTSKSRAFIHHDDLRQVLLGLLDNAMRHTPDGGKIELTATGDEGVVRFSITDNGEGIDKDVLPHVFDRFYRAEASRGRGKGSGLGLSICKQVIESYDGKIYLRSVKGSGTTVTFLIPMRQSSAREMEN